MFKKIEKRLIKSGMNCSVQYSDAYTIPVNIQRRDMEYCVDIKVVDVNVETTGWQYLSEYTVVAVLEHFNQGNSEYKNIVHSFREGGLTVDEYRILAGLKPRCQHCNTNRLRKKTVILCRKDNEQLVQVGMSCIDNYLDLNIAELLEQASNLERFILKGLEENSVGCCGSNKDITVDIPWLVATELYMAEYSTRYSTGGKPNARAIAEEIEGFMYSIDLENSIKKYLPKAQEIVEYVKSSEYRDYSDFENKCVSICMNGIIRRRNIRLAVWIPAVYYSKLERKEKELKKAQMEQERKERAVKSEYIGDIGDKLKEIWVYCERRLYSGEMQVKSGITVTYGVYLLRYNNQDVIYRTSGVGLMEGYKYFIKSAKIKKTEEYNGIKQTHITNVRITDSDKDTWYKKSKEDSEED